MMYPKVLILFETFHLNSGGGITLTNLFKDWDKSAIANSTMFYNLDNCFDNTICSNYYSLGNKELKTNNMLRKFIILGKSGIKTQGLKQDNRTIGIVPSFIPSIIKKKIKNIFQILGFDNNLFSLSVSEDFLDWVRDFNPDIIYAQPGSKATFLFLEELSNKTKIPLVLHVMDDWIKVKQSNFINRIFKDNISDLFVRSVKSSNLLFTISEGMRNAYNDRYGKESNVFHNTLDIDKWIQYTKKEFEFGEIIRILYAGRIGIGTYYSLMELVKASKDLVEEGIRLEIHIQSPTINDMYRKKLISFNFIKINKMVVYDMLPKIFSSYDILLLPIDFEKKGKQWLKYSMPTKVPEFMISGTPILLYAPNDIFLYENAVENKWAYVINEKSKLAIKKGLKELISDLKLRRSLSKNAFKYAVEQYDGVKIREKFRSTLMEVIPKSNS